ncbi:MAG: CRISPR system precrRNA processing endoribonuclease RAMP protein Cas6 [Fretibacterium sp.]|nr:CRISPR system precrRNA processing endoribonuclease RAMP protein Cas6 [Fretibacterium sp.]
MFGIAILRLRAEKDAVLPRVHGRLMHGAFFSLLRTVDPALSEAVHSNMNIKPFTVSDLSTWDEADGRGRGRRGGRGGERGPVRRVAAGTQFAWRVTALTDPVLQAVGAFPVGGVCQAGELPLCVEEIIMDSRRQAGTGVIDPETLMPRESDRDLQRITFHFRSPVSFRRDKDDLPIPAPGFIFASLSDKWQGAGLAPLAGKAILQEDAARLLPMAWEGRTVRHFLSADRGVLAFRGSFTFGLRDVPESARGRLAALTRFAPCAGVGRLCAQGMGQTEVELM